MRSATGTDSGHLPYLPALDGIRALAVAAVLAFHGGVAAVGGGFLGVDAFFVLSGFLITSLLLAERQRTGRVDLVAFWGRRARRLLPALLLVLVAVVTVSRWLMPPEELAALRVDALAAAAYLANWRMADRRGGGYFAETAAPSPLQHTWSLGIEEQFYLLWPVLLVALLALLRRAGQRRSRALLVGACLVGAAASAVAAGILVDPHDLDRVYYGTDTRALALLIGAALAAALTGRHADPNSPVGVQPPTGTSAAGTARRRHRTLGALATAGAAATLLLWMGARGAAPWLYPGGLVLAALAVAAVIAHAVVSPGSPTARLLAVAPLVWLGRISYGVYLWHWPLFGWLSADRTGLTGAGLFAARCAATVAVAVASYLLVERPIRTARWTRRRRVVPTLTAAALAATAATVVIATVPPPVPPAPPILLDQALAMPTAAAPELTGAGDRGPSASRSPAPVHRPGRRAGERPRIAIMGDSVAWSLGAYLPEQRQLQVTSRGVPGCGIARLPEIRYIGIPHPNYPGCTTWDRRWRRAVQKDDPDVAAILLDRWELMDRKLHGRYRHVGQPDYDAYLNRELDLAIRIAGSRGGHVVLLTAPYTRRAERPDGGLWPEDQPQRVDAWNALLRAAADRHGATVIDLNRRVCPDGRFTWRAGDVQVRSDGLHFTPSGVRRWIAPWLLPQLARLAVRGPSPAPATATAPTIGP